MVRKFVCNVNYVKFFPCEFVVKTTYVITRIQCDECGMSTMWLMCALNEIDCSRYGLLLLLLVGANLMI
jgi:hypothetical protein